MWDAIIGLLPNKGVWLCTAITAILPYLVYKINQKVHKVIDPPWKNSNNSGR